MIHKPIITSVVAGHGDTRQGVFIECDTPKEAESCLTSVFELVDVTDEEMYYPLGIWLSLEEAIAVVDQCKDDPAALPSPIEYEEYAKVEIRERRIGWSENNLAVFERKWVKDYDAAQDKYCWRRA